MYKTRFLLPVLLVSLLAISSSSYGQATKDSLKYELGLNVSGRKISGTFNQVVAGGGFEMDLLYRNWHLENNASYRFNQTNGRVLEDNWYDLATLKYYPNGNKKLYPGVFYHFDNNLMFRVKGRHNYGIGVGSVLDKRAMKLSVLGAIAHADATFNGSEFANSDRDVARRKNGLFLFRVDNGYSFANNRINLFYQLFYFQSLKESADYDIRINSRISFKVYKGLSFFAAYNYHFENVHLEALSNYNDIIAYGINWKIKG